MMGGQSPSVAIRMNAVIVSAIHSGEYIFNSKVKALQKQYSLICIKKCPNSKAMPQTHVM